MTITCWTVMHRRRDDLFLGRGEAKLRDFPLLFGKREQAAELMNDAAQVPDDWKVVEVDCVLKVE